MSPVKIMVVDDHRIFRQGLMELLRKNIDYKVVGEAGNGREALEKIKDIKPNIIFLDISMPELNGIDAIDEIKKTCPSCRIIILSMYDNSKYISFALKHGVSGYLLKDIEIDELYRSIKTVMENEIYLCDKINKKIIRDYAVMARAKVFSAPMESLSARETEVFQLIAEGFTSKEIASKLNISNKTVEHHRYSMMEKLGCHNTAQIVRLALKEEIIIP